MSITQTLLQFPQQFFDNDGTPLSGGSLTFYVGGTVNTPQNTYSDQALTVLNPNPITLNSAGFPIVSNTEVKIYPISAAYKIVVKDSSGTVLHTWDNVEPNAPWNLSPFGLTVGVSGGIPYFSSTTTQASSALLTAHGVLVGGGAGTTPAATAAGAAGTFLVSTNASANPSFLAPGGAQTSPASFTINSASDVMCGMAGAITPVVTGRVLIIINFYAVNASSAANAQYTIKTGTGTAPANNAAVTGTTRGVQMKSTPSTAYDDAVTITAIVTGLTLSTAIWIDLAASNAGGQNTTIVSNIVAIEF